MLIGSSSITASCRSLPTVTFEYTKILQVNGDELRLARHTPAHIWK